MIATNKMRFFSGRDIQFMPPPAPPDFEAPDLPPGSIVVLHSAYPPWTEPMLVRAYQCWRVAEIPDSLLLPLFPDIMERPGTAQNPTAWIYRYEPQHFWTSIWRIDSKRVQPPE
jgi:hypothetical protein